MVGSGKSALSEERLRRLRTLVRLHGMLHRALIIAFLAAGLLAIPPLCRAGLIEHACVCEIMAGCAHEESCPGDPCLVSKPTNDLSTSVNLIGINQPLGPFNAAEPFISVRFARSGLDTGASARSHALRFGTRPLLI